MLSHSYGQERIKIAQPVKARRYDQIEDVLEKLIYQSDFRERFKNAQEGGSSVDNLLCNLRKIMRDFPDELAQSYADQERPLKRKKLSEKEFSTVMNKQFSFPWMKNLIDSGLSENESALEIAKCFLPNACPDDTQGLDKISNEPDLLYRPTELNLKCKADSILKAYRRFKAT